MSSWEILSVRLLTGFPGGSVVKNPPANAGDTDTTPAPGRSPMPGGYKVRAPQLLSLGSRAGEPQLLSSKAKATEALKP